MLYKKASILFYFSFHQLLIQQCPHLLTLGLFTVIIWWVTSFYFSKHSSDLISQQSPPQDGVDPYAQASILSFFHTCSTLNGNTPTTIIASTQVLFQAHFQVGHWYFISGQVGWNRSPMSLTCLTIWLKPLISVLTKSLDQTQSAYAGKGTIFLKLSSQGIKTDILLPLCLYDIPVWLTLNWIPITNCDLSTKSNPYLISLSIAAPVQFQNDATIIFA